MIIGTISVYCVAFHDLKQLTWPDPLSSLDLRSAMRERNISAYDSRCPSTSSLVFQSAKREKHIWLWLMMSFTSPLVLQSFMRENTRAYDFWGSLVVSFSSNPPWERTYICLWLMRFSSWPFVLLLSARGAREIHLPTSHDVLHYSPRPPILHERDNRCLHLMTSSNRLLVLQSSTREIRLPTTHDVLY